MRATPLLLASALAACSGTDAAPAKPPPKPAAKLTYTSDCSLTHPVARNPCEGQPASTRGLARCASLGVKRGDRCTATSPSCYVETACGDGRAAVSDYYVCVAETPGKCLTRSTAQLKTDIRYLSEADVRAVARQVESLRLARFRYTDQDGGQPRLGFLTQDAAGAEFVSPDGRTVDLYSLLSASIAALQAQDARIRVLEERCGISAAP
ncbi:MAG: tail fiber domain-containing protein [Myxococcales bacterium]|nr:tail fiber domain-containing protein [Myxococcales bacterium]